MKTILFLLLVSSICVADDEERNTYIYNYYYNVGSSMPATQQSGVGDMMTLIYMASKGEYKNNLNGGCTYKTVDVKLSNGTMVPYNYCN